MVVEDRRQDVGRCVAAVDDAITDAESALSRVGDALADLKRLVTVMDSEIEANRRRIVAESEELAEASDMLADHGINLIRGRETDADGIRRLLSRWEAERQLLLEDKT